ncbi:hypothetical protein AB0M46_48310 [Dactylosporangium sp. NPDC051485]|uniref:hypothetical protein n=1 Tax=Dactylosporangium sp. NPDC051485 TaxID=3154846 RepID=UPI0034398DAE
MLDVTGTAGELSRVAYLIVGLLVLGAAFLPGNGPLYRVASLLVGVVMSAFAVWDLTCGANQGTVGAVAMLPALGLLVIGAVGMVRAALARRSGSAQPPPRRPHPAARQFGGPGSYQPHPPHAYGRSVPAAYPGAPGYATVHAAYPAYPGVPDPAARPEIAAQRTAAQADPLAAVTPAPPRHRAGEPPA